MMTINYEACTKSAKHIVSLYHDKQLELIKVGHNQLKKWLKESVWTLQVRENLINPDIVAEIIDKIRYYKHINYADPILAVKSKVGGQEGYFLVNGNNTCSALEQTIRFSIVDDLDEVSVALIDNDMLPKNKAELHETLKQVATLMNVQPKVHRGMAKNDMTSMIKKDFIDGVDIKHPPYMRAKAESAHMPVSTIKTIVSKILANSEEARINQKFHFKPLTPSEIAPIKVLRIDPAGTTFVQIATVTKDKMFGSFAGCIQHVVEHDHCKDVHVIFHFAKYRDIAELKKSTIEKIERFAELVNFNVTYEFLDHLQIVDDKGLNLDAAE